MRIKGKITSWNDDKGYGFITPRAGGKQVFVHINEFGNRNRRPEINEAVTYALSKDKQGRPCAVKAALAGDKHDVAAPRRKRTAAILFALAFLATVGIAVFLGKLPVAVIAAYSALSLATFVVYALDKSAARRAGQRISEKALHIFGLFGGWPGALIAQQTLRHKSKKTSFRVVFWFTVILNCAALIGLGTEMGREFLQRVVVRANS